MQTQSKACCSRPPVTIAGGYNYTPKGTYVSYNGFKTYETGSTISKRGILLVYDIFGLYIQTIRGADILSSGHCATPDTAGDFKVFMPDWFGDSPADIANYPPKTPPQSKAIADFLDGPANPEKTLALIEPLMKDIKKKHPEIEKWAILGFCWGGKIAALLSGKESMFKASAQAHPSLLEVRDAQKITIPHCVLASMEEVPEIMEEWNQALIKASPKSYTETFTDQVHGWMTSKADFNQLHNFEEYLRGYRIVRSFFVQFM